MTQDFKSASFVEKIKILISVGFLLLMVFLAGAFIFQTFFTGWGDSKDEYPVTCDWDCQVQTWQDDEAAAREAEINLIKEEAWCLQDEDCDSN